MAVVPADDRLPSAAPGLVAQDVLAPFGLPLSHLGIDPLGEERPGAAVPGPWLGGSGTTITGTGHAWQQRSCHACECSWVSADPTCFLCGQPGQAGPLASLTARRRRSA